MNKKKKIFLGIILAIILIGIIVVGFKGFNVGLSLRPHHTFYFVFEQEYNVEDVKKICKEVFKDKAFRIRGVEVFNDAIYVESSTITAEEEKVLAEKFDALYKTEKVEETEKEIDYDVYHDSNIKIMDEIKPYVASVVISAIIILLYVAMRFKKLNDGKIYKTFGNLIFEALIVVLLPLSIIAIVRLPLEIVTFSILIIIEIVYLIIKFAMLENKLKEV